MGARQDAGELTELPADLLDHIEGVPRDREHRERAEQWRRRRAQEDASDHDRVPETDRQLDTPRANDLGVCGEQREHSQGCCADAEALGNGLGRIARGVEHVGCVNDLLRHTGHLGDAARVVHDRAVRVGRDDHPADGEHTHGADADAIDSRHTGLFRKVVGEQCGDGDSDDGRDDADEAIAEARDDVDGGARA